jgi:2-polyprenyl-3-methyl-5-hydroxy-6-metoxy-1,4-benzoquinol methylase
MDCVKRKKSDDFKCIGEAVWKSFPFEGFPNTMRCNREITRTIMRYLPTGATVLDYASGSCSRSAFLSRCGFRVFACDDLSDAWHLQNGNRERISMFAEKMGVSFHLVEATTDCPYRKDQFDLVMMNDILEHLHDSPRTLLCRVVEWTKPGGYLLITVPNAANLRKRASLLFGKSNYPPYGDFFWHPSPFRGHVREYVVDDLRQLCNFMNLKSVELRDIHIWVDVRLKNAVSRCLYLCLTSMIPFSGVRDSLLLLAQKPSNWRVDAAPPALGEPSYY